jgi:hypothetical protein
VSGASLAGLSYVTSPHAGNRHAQSVLLPSVEQRSVKLNLLLKIPLNIPDEIAGTFLEAQQNITDLFFRDLLSAKQTALLETFSANYPASPEQLAAMRETLKSEITLIEKSMELKTIELVSGQVDHETV